MGRAKVDPENGRIPPASAVSVAGSAGADGKRRRNEGRGRRPAEEQKPTQQPLGLEVDDAEPSLAAEREKGNKGAE